MIARIYVDGFYDEGTGDELAARETAHSRLMIHEVELRGQAVLPDFFQEAKTLAATPPEVVVADLGSAGERARLGELAMNAKGAANELDVLLAIREQLDIHITRLQNE